MLPIRIVRSNVSSVGPSLERNISLKCGKVRCDGGDGGGDDGAW